MRIAPALLGYLGIVLVTVLLGVAAPNWHWFALILVVMAAILIEDLWRSRR